MEDEEFVSLRSTVGYKSVHNCNYCSYFSKSIFFMRNHVRRHRSSKEIFNCQKNQVETFCCLECDFNTEIFMSLRKHLEEVHVSDKGTIPYILKDYTCTKCSFQTYSLLHWLGHFSICGNVIDSDDNGYLNCLQIRNFFTCDQCPYESTKKDGLKAHKIQKHTSEENINWFRCDQCPYKTKQKRNLNMHKLCKHTSEKDINWFKCDQCSYKTKRKWPLKSHKFYRHNSEQNIIWFKCDQCSYKSKCKKSLENYKIRKHIPEKDINWFQCDQCTHKSKGKSDLKTHKIRKHTSEKDINWFKCDQCPYKSKDKFNLKRHKTAKHQRKTTL